MKKLIKFIRKYEMISLGIVFGIPFIAGIILTKVLQSEMPMLCADFIAVSGVIIIEFVICGEDDNTK